MASDWVERKLVAIMFTDIVGSTALMAESEQKGLGVLERHRALVVPVIEQYGGEAIEAKGDETLSVFGNALDAVNCALAIHGRLAGDAELKLHIGIHSSDILLRPGEISGDGVNIAARICALSDGDATYVSAEVHQAVRNQPHLTRNGRICLIRSLSCQKTTYRRYRKGAFFFLFPSNGQRRVLPAARLSGRCRSRKEAGRVGELLQLRSAPRSPRRIDTLRSSTGEATLVKNVRLNSQHHSPRCAR